MNFKNTQIKSVLIKNAKTNTHTHHKQSKKSNDILGEISGIHSTNPTSLSGKEPIETTKSNRTSERGPKGLTRQCAGKKTQKAKGFQEMLKFTCNKRNTNRKHPMEPFSLIPLGRSPVSHKDTQTLLMGF